MIIENFIKSFSEKNKVSEDVVLRIYRLLVVVSSLLTIVFGGYFSYLIITDQSIAKVSAILLATLLMVVGIGIFIYLIFAPIVLYIWYGRMSNQSDDDEEDFSLALTAFSFFCIIISAVIYYNAGVFVGQIDKICGLGEKILNYVF